MIINCTADQVEYLFAPPTIMWRDPNDALVSSDSNSNPRMDPVTRQLIFSGINSRNSGTYTCQAVIDIPQAQIINHIDMAAINANINCKGNLIFWLIIVKSFDNLFVDTGSVQNMMCAKSSSPTKLSFSWELPTLLGNEVVGYHIEVKGLRHRERSREVVQFDVDSFNTETREVTIIGHGIGIILVV